MSNGGYRPPLESRHRSDARDGRPSRARPSPEGGLQEAARLAAARRTAITRAVGTLYAPMLDQPLPDAHTALLERLGTREARRR